MELESISFNVNVQITCATGTARTVMTILIGFLIECMFLFMLKKTLLSGSKKDVLMRTEIY